MSKLPIPTFDAMMNPLIQSLKGLGGSGTIEEINTKVAEIAGLTDKQLEILHNPAQGGATEVEYRLGWARTYLKQFGILENSGRGVWALTPSGSKVDHVDEKEVKRVVQAKTKHTRSEDVNPEEQTIADNWRDELLDVLGKMPPSAFEKLAQRMLRESGFTQVEVTGRTGDGGIDGKGILRLAGLLSFQIIFQCKRWKGSVSAAQVRDFRGAMVGRADKGLLITTGTFTKDAVREATRDGASAIDLIDGEQFVDKLKELGLGVQTRKVEVEQVTIDKDWFTNL